MCPLVVVIVAGGLSMLLRSLFVALVGPDRLPAGANRLLPSAGPVVLAALIGSHLAAGSSLHVEPAAAVATVTAAALARLTRGVGSAVAGGLVTVWVVAVLA